MKNALMGGLWGLPLGTVINGFLHPSDAIIVCFYVTTVIAVATTLLVRVIEKSA